MIVLFRLNVGRMLRMAPVVMVRTGSAGRLLLAILYRVGTIIASPRQGLFQAAVVLAAALSLPLRRLRLMLLDVVVGGHNLAQCAFSLCAEIW